MFEKAEENFRAAAPRAEFWSLRLVRQRGETLWVRRGVLQPVTVREDAGAMLLLRQGGGTGYAATCDLSREGFRRAAEEAAGWARLSARSGLVDHAAIPYPHPAGEYESPCRVPWGEVPIEEKVGLLRELDEILGRGPRIVDCDADLTYTEEERLYLTSGGGRVRQRFRYLSPDFGAVAAAGGQTQRRSHGMACRSRQGGWEVLQPERLRALARRYAEEAEELLGAPNCPSGRMDLLLDPDQMYLQIHESVGHPLEIDRILGDERNYAGTSFVTADMFGRYRYGSERMNVTFDPGVAGEFAGYAFDDEGVPARREHLIEEGILLRGLGGLTSQARSGLPGVACTRAAGWKRPPIDRMANLNVEPGESPLERMIASVERGVYMKTNCSWSIDDSRLKFQFGCEWARLIEEGRLTRVVRNPNYRGVTPEFWRGLRLAGDASTLEVLGTPECGKGEPNQTIRVGHASPACLFSDVEVFGGE